MFKIQVFVLFYLTNKFYCACDSQTFVKNENYYERYIQNETVILENSTLFTIPDYIHTTQTLLEHIEKGYVVSSDNLNKFNLGIHQYYLSQAYEKIHTKAVSYIPEVEFNDPVPLPNATALGEPNLYFYGVHVYSFPGFQKTYKVSSELGNDIYLQHFKIDLSSKSDVIIFRGYFSVFEENYFFVYYLKQNVLKSRHIKLRKNDGTIITKKIKDILSFSSEHLIHTYDSAYKKFYLVNETLTNKLMSVVEQLWLPTLVSMTYERLIHKMAAENVKFARLYRQKVIQCLMQSSFHYLKLENLSSFYLSSVNFTTRRHNREYVQIYEDLKVEGLLNHNGYELTDSKVEENNEYLHLSDTVTVSFADQPANINFNVGDLRREMIPKSFKIKYMNITTNYYVDTKQLPLKLLRNIDSTSNETGFSISFELDNFDPVYIFLIKHIGNDMARAIRNLLNNETDLFKKL